LVPVDVALLIYFIKEYSVNQIILDKCPVIIQSNQIVIRNILCGILMEISKPHPYQNYGAISIVIFL